MKRFYEANASETPPKPPVNPSYGYPQNGNRSLNQKPTKLGAYWFHMITEEFMAVIEGAGLEPSETNLHQLADIFADFRDRASGAETFKKAAEAAAKLAEDFAKLAKESADIVVTNVDETIKKIQAEGQAQVTTVTNTGAAQVKAVEASGATQTANAKAQADSASKSATEATTQANKSKAWATQTGSAVEGGLYSALHYATHAESQAKKAETSATVAHNWSEKLDGPVSGDQYSARFWVQRAQQESRAAQTSATAAKLSETNAKASEEAALVAKERAEEVAETLENPLGKEEAAQTYATKTELTNGLATKQPTGDYATNKSLTDGLATKQPTGDYATRTELNNGLNGKANSSHSHAYVPTSGGTINGSLTVTGTLKGGTVQSTSDRRLKTNISELESLDIASVKAYRYVLKSDGMHHVGLIAQDLIKVLPEAVQADEKGFLSIDYNAVVALLVNRVQSLEARLSKLEGK